MIGPDGEAFYQLANATLTPRSRPRRLVIVDFNVEAAFLDADPITFGRIQFTAKNLVANATYTVDHPYGTSTFTTDGTATSRAAFAPLSARKSAAPGGPCDFNVACSGRRSVRSSAARPPRRATSATASRETTVTGGSVRNTVSVSGPGLPPAITDEPGVIVTPAGITTDKFVVEGKLFDPTAVIPPAPVPAPGHGSRRRDRQRRPLRQPAGSGQQQRLPAAGDHRQHQADASGADGTVINRTVVQVIPGAAAGPRRDGLVRWPSAG